MTSFAKYEISGNNAEKFLNRICANRIPKIGGVSLVHMLTELGGIEGEATITRLEDNLFYVLSAAVAEIHDYDWFSQHILPEENVKISNVTDDYGVFIAYRTARTRCPFQTDGCGFEQQRISLDAWEVNRSFWNSTARPAGFLCGRTWLGTAPCYGQDGNAL